MKPVHRLLGTTVTLLALLAPRPLAGQAAHLRELGAKFQRQLERAAEEAPGVLGVAVVDLQTGERFGVNAALPFPQGSAIKIPVLLELFRQAETGRLRLDERVELRAADMVGGSGVLRTFGDGTSQLALRDLAVLMIVLSDNTATNLLIDRVGMESVNATMRELGLPGIRLQRRMIRPADSAAGRENLATATEAVDLMARIHRCELPLGAEACRELRAILEIPKEGALVRPIPAGVRAAWKPGGLEGVSTAWGIVELAGRPYALAVMLNYSDARAGATVERVSAAAYAHFARLAGATPHGTRVPLEHAPPPAPPGRR